MSELSRAVDALNGIRNFDIEELEQRDRLGKELAFTEAVQYGRAFQNLVSRLSEDSLPLLPQNSLKQLYEYAEAVREHYNHIKAFKSADGPQGRDALTGQLRSTVNQAFDKLGGPISITVINQLDLATFEKLRDEYQSSSAAEVSRLVADLKEQQKGLKETEETLRRAAADRGIGSEAKFFNNEAGRHGIGVWLWGILTIFMSICVGVYGVATFFLPKWLDIELTSTPAAIQFTASKLIVLFSLTYFLFLCARNFRANRHNQIVNRHRHNALQTYRTLVEAGESRELQEVVLHHAAAAIYHLHDTGLVKSEGNAQPSMVDFVPRATLPIKTAAEQS